MKQEIGNLIIHLKNVKKVNNKIYNTVSYPIYNDYTERNYNDGSVTRKTIISQIDYYLKKHNVEDNGYSAFLRGYSMLPTIFVNDVPHVRWRAKPKTSYYNSVRNLRNTNFKQEF
tara:strand:- start:811 stop:1155 length:345 start_codon:yes stop_codon:yes gene_type:complete